MKLFLKRIAALFYDTLIVFCLLLLVTSIAVALFPSNTLHHNLIFRSTLFLSWFGIIVYCWTKNACTLGMRAWNLQLVTFDGAPLKLKHCIIRFLFSLPSLLCFGIGFLWMLFDKKNLALHDRLSKTAIIAINK